MCQDFPETEQRFIYFNIYSYENMHKTEYDILSLYKKNPHKIYSTTDIVRAVEPEFEEVEKSMKDPYSDKETIKKAKRKKAQMHRKVLYYLTKLVEEKVLKITKEGAKGEKYFSISLEEGEELSIEKYKKREITISKPRTPAMPIEGYEQAGIVLKFEESTWIDRLNCLVFESTTIKDLAKLTKILDRSFSLVNDCIGINNFELFINNSSTEEIISSLDRLESDCRDFAKKITLIIDTSMIHESTDITTFIEIFSTKKYDNIYIVFDTESKELEKHYQLFEKIINKFSTNAIPLYIKNKNIAKSPYCYGNAGVYTFDENEWKNYTENIKGKTACVSCAQSTLSIDVRKFYDTFGFNMENFEKFIINCAESLLSANSIQRRKASEFFEYLIELNTPNAQEVFMFSRNYLRFWNYDYLKEKFDIDFETELFRKVREITTNFSISEETIYKSCGMPTRFKVCFAAAAESVYTNIFTKLEYKHTEIKGFEDLYAEEIKQKIKNKENMNTIFNGGLFIDFARTGNIKEDEVIRELNTILNTYKIPFFVYKFRKTKGVDLKLNEFIEGKR
jgi:hypothetical protein